MHIVADGERERYSLSIVLYSKNKNSNAYNCKAYRKKGTLSMFMAAIMSDFYATSLPCISSKSILDAQNAMKSIANRDGFDRLLSSNADVKALYEIPSAHDTIDAVIASGDGTKRASFQGGMLTECVFADYLARALGANATYVNCD